MFRLMFLLGAIGNDSTYIKQLKAIMKKSGKYFIAECTHGCFIYTVTVHKSKALAEQIELAEEYINDDYKLSDTLKPGRLIIVDLRMSLLKRTKLGVICRNAQYIFIS